MFKLVIMLFLPFCAGAQMSAEALLTQADNYRSPYQYSQLDIKIEDYKDQQLSKSRRYRVYHRAGESLVNVLDGVNKGNRILLSNKGMYIALKNASRAVRITPIQRLLGQASYGDLAGLRFAEHYTPSVLKEQTGAIILQLLAKKSSATYRRIVLWIDKHDYRPLKADAYLASNKLYKQMRYTIKDKLVSAITYTSPKNNHKKTTMSFLSVKSKKLPKRFFTSHGMRSKI